MRKLTLALLSLAVLVPSWAFATVNHGDFIGTSVDFLQVSETTQTAGDPEPIWGAPIIAGTGDQLAFFPANFTSSCAAGSSDVTTSVMTTDIVAQPGGHIDNVTLNEAGDVTLTKFPPFGTPLTNASAALSGTITVTEDISGPIAPVVIPFVGSVSPSSTFSLPGNFGLSNWTGNISVDVAGVVPNATKVTLALDNTLTSNCEAGASSGSIQKKTVSGPAVAISVNPISCDLQVDKTCCVTRPPNAEFGSCEGDLTRLDLEFTGDKCSASNNDQGRAFRCYGRRPIEGPASVIVKNGQGVVTASPSSGINEGDVVTLSSSTGTLFDKTKLKTTGSWWRKQYLKIDTSCERSIQCGDQFGAYKVVGLDSTLGGNVDCSAPPGPPVCATPGFPAGTQCDAKVVDIVYEYTGADCVDPLGNPQNGDASCWGNAGGANSVGIVYNGHFAYKHQVAPSSGINVGDRVRVTSSHRGGLFPNQSYLITDSSGVLQEIGLHTSCSQPLALGDEFGALKVVEFTTKSGNTFAIGDGTDGTADSCEVPLAPPKPHCTSDLQDLTLVFIGDFLGEGCTTSNDQSGYASCSGVSDPGDPVSVVFGSGLEGDPIDQIEFGDLVTVSAIGGGDLPSFVNLDVTGAGGTQSIQIKTSCHKPLSLGDRFGSFVVFGMDRQDEGPITLGGNVQYQYTVTNPNADTVDNISVDDDQLGNIASGVSLPAGQSVTFTKDATLFGVTTNVATASGDVLGNFCDPGTDQVTIDVVVPPSGAFSCSCWQSLSEVSLTWDGTETVDIVVWDGAVGGTQIGTFDDVLVGDTVTQGGFTADYSTWEIYDSTGTTKLGESKFHLTCRDRAMNGVEDCGKRVGDGKYNDPAFLNDWLVEGLVDDDETLSCSPTSVPNGPDCGLGPELALLLPGLLIWRRRRLNRA